MKQEITSLRFEDDGDLFVFMPGDSITVETNVSRSILISSHHFSCFIHTLNCQQTTWKGLITST